MERDWLSWTEKERDWFSWTEKERDWFREQRRNVIGLVDRRNVIGLVEQRKSVIGLMSREGMWLV